MMNNAQGQVENQTRWLWTDVRSIDVQEQDVVHLSGNVNFERSPKIRKILLEAVAEKRNVLVDLSKVTYIDSSGIACLVKALAMARNQGADLSLLSVSTEVMRVLKLARLDMVFPILKAYQVERIH
jgi:anti-sigma B factor antagonist